MPAPKQFPLSVEHLRDDLIKQVTFVLSEELKRKVEIVADAFDVSINWLMRFALLLYALRHGYTDLKISASIVGDLYREMKIGD